MTTDEKVEEVLRFVRETREMTLETQRATLETQRVTLEERALNNSRFSQLATGLSDLRTEVHVGLAAVNARIDKVYDSLSQDIQAFAGDLHDVKLRVTRLEKKTLS